MKTIEITVAPNGATRLETRGFAGVSCLAASRLIEEGLGLVTSRRTAEYFAAVRDEQTHLQKGNAE